MRRSIGCGVAPPPPAPLPQGEGESSFAPSPCGRGREGGRATATPAERALQAAAAAATLEELRAAIAAFDGCALRDTASNLVFAEGDPNADTAAHRRAPWPGRRPLGHSRSPDPRAPIWTGCSASIGLERGRLMLAPLIPWRPPGDRPPSPAELAVCLPFLHRLIALVPPRRLLLMGPLTARSLLPQSTSRRRPRGAWMDTADRACRRCPRSAPPS